MLWLPEFRVSFRQWSVVNNLLPPDVQSNCSEFNGEFHRGSLHLDPPPPSACSKSEKGKETEFRGLFSPAARRVFCRIFGPREEELNGHSVCASCILCCSKHADIMSAGKVRSWAPPHAKCEDVVDMILYEGGISGGDNFVVKFRL